jgi:ATP/maltotriose-dependent transcriptional regulator MalT
MTTLRISAGRRLGHSRTHGRPRVPSAAVSGFDELSERELAVLRLLSSRLSPREVGNELYVSMSTIKTHTRSFAWAAASRP